MKRFLTGPVVILSDTFYEFASPLMSPLGFPALFCHSLEIAETGRIIGYNLRHPDHKRASVEAFPNYAEYQAKAPRMIPVFVAEPAP